MPLLTPKNIRDNCNSIDFYLAGMIEGDGSIKIPKTARSDKGKLLYPSVTIVFAAKDLPLAQYLAKLLNGTVSKAKGEYFFLSIYSLISLHYLVKRINGKFRTPKIEAFHRLIYWLYEYNKFEKLDLLPLDNSNLNSNAWVAGFSDCDSNFLITYSNSNGIAKDIKLVFRISQRTNYHRDSELGTSYLPVLTDIATVFKTKVTSFERNRVNKKNNYIELGYLVTVSSLSSRIELINYFSNFPVLSSKYLDYKNWLEAHEIVKSKKYISIDGTAKLVELKNSMNSKRNYFSWNHLNTYNE